MKIRVRYNEGNNWHYVFVDFEGKKVMTVF